MATIEQDRTKFLKNEITAFENRLASTKSELESLRIQRDALKNEIQTISAACQKEVETKLFEVRKEAATVDEGRRKLESDRAELKTLIEDFAKNRVSLDRERQECFDLKKDAQLTMDRVGVFIRMVRDGASKL